MSGSKQIRRPTALPKRCHEHSWSILKYHNHLWDILESSWDSIAYPGIACFLSLALVAELKPGLVSRNAWLLWSSSPPFEDPKRTENARRSGPRRDSTEPERTKSILKAVGNETHTKHNTSKKKWRNHEKPFAIFALCCEASKFSWIWASWRQIAANSGESSGAWLLNMEASSVGKIHWT